LRVAFGNKKQNAVDSADSHPVDKTNKYSVNDPISALLIMVPERRPLVDKPVDKLLGILDGFGEAETNTIDIIIFL
jgi:hypothetical protein